MKSKGTKKGKAKGKAPASRSALATIFTAKAKPSKILRKADGGMVSGASNMMASPPPRMPGMGGAAPISQGAARSNMMASPPTRQTPPQGMRPPPHGILQKMPGMGGMRPPAQGMPALGGMRPPMQGMPPQGMLPGRPGAAPQGMPPRMGGAAPQGMPGMAPTQEQFRQRMPAPVGMAKGGDVKKDPVTPEEIKAYNKAAIQKWKQGVRNWASQDPEYRRGQVYTGIPMLWRRKKVVKPPTEDPKIEDPPLPPVNPPVNPPPTNTVVPTPPSGGGGTGGIVFGTPATGRFPIYTPPVYQPPLYQKAAAPVYQPPAPRQPLPTPPVFQGYAKGGLVTRKSPKKYI